MKLLSLTIASLLLVSPALAGSVLEACKRLCPAEPDCLKKCAAHAELFELPSTYIEAVIKWDKSPEVRMQVLRSGASIEALDVCQQTGWSMENRLTCLRADPPASVIKTCKKLSPLQDEQVRCVRAGKTEAEINACNLLVPGSNLRLECLHKNVTAQETHFCRHTGGDSRARMDCLNRIVAVREAEGDQFLKEVRQRVAEEERLEKRDRLPASAKKKRGR